MRNFTQLCSRLCRSGVNFFNYSFDKVESGNDYDFSLKLKSFSALLDFHPILGRGLRITGGLVINNNKLEMVGQSSATYTIGDVIYTANNVGTLNGDVKFKSIAPYAGIGWGNAASTGFGFAVDLGIALQGSPEVTLDATGPIANDVTFIQELNQENQELEDSISGFKYYPVISLGISFGIPTP